MFIYKITNIINNKVYVGKTSLRRAVLRWNRHKSNLKNNIHDNKHLQYAYNKYGIKAFKFEILDEVVFDSGLNNLEIFWIKYLQSNNPNFGYNMTTGGEGIVGYKHTKLSIDKMRGRVMSEENKIILSKLYTGTKLPIETKLKISKSLIGNQFGKKNKGSKRTIEQRLRQSEAAKKRWSKNGNS